MFRKQRVHTEATGFAAASQTFAGVSHPEWDKVIEQYQRLNSSEARGVFADHMLRHLSLRLNHTWPVLYNLLKIVDEQKVYETPDYLVDKQPFASFEAYFEKVVGRPFDSWA